MDGPDVDVDSDSGELHFYADELERFSFLSRRRPWYADDRIAMHLALQQLCASVCDILADDRSGALDIGVVQRVHNELLDRTVWYLAEAYDPVPEQDDEYLTTPLLTMYTAAAAALAYLVDHGADASALPDIFLQQASADDYCVRNKLAISPSRIADYSVMEVFVALDRLQERLRLVTCEPQLRYYVDALEARFSEILTRSYGDACHNVGDMRVAVGGADEYALTIKATFEGALHFCSLREELSSALVFMRAPVCGEMLLLVPSDADTEVMRAHLEAEARRVHSDEFSDSARRNYQALCVRPYEAYMFLKRNIKATSVEPYKVIQEDLNQVQRWKDICTAAAVEPSCVLHECTDAVGVRIVLHLLMEIIMQQDAKMPWATFEVTQPSLITPDRGVLETLITRSHRFPLYAMCLNDACVIYRGAAYSMGCGALACVRALGLWLNVVNQRCGGMLGVAADFNNIYHTLTGAHPQLDLTHAVLPPTALCGEPKKHTVSQWGAYF